MARKLRNLLRDRSGGLSIELVIALPLIAVAQALAFDVGRIIIDQHALESGVRDAARYLARAQVDECPDAGTGYWKVYHRLVATGVQSDIVSSDIQCNFRPLFDGSTSALRVEYTRVEIVAEINVTTPLTRFAAWGAWDGGITIAASDQARFIGE